MASKVAFPVLSTVLLIHIYAGASQHWPCQIQSFFVRKEGYIEGNLLRVHLNESGVPTNVTFTGSCDSATLRFTKFNEERRVINGTFLVSFRWAVNPHYVLAVKKRALVLKFDPKRVFSYRQWFILKSCGRCYAGLDKFKSLSMPHLYVKSDSSGIPFLGRKAGTMAWFEIMTSVC